MEKIDTSNLKVKIFADGAEKSGMFEMLKNPLIAGFTTNPTLMKKAGIKDYKSFALDVLSEITEQPISFEVFSDEFSEMEAQALEIASWAQNVNVKIPITNTKGESSAPLIERLAKQNVKLNVTAIFTMEQVKAVAPVMAEGAGGYVSIFAGRIADTGRDPLPLMTDTVKLLKDCGGVELIWASPRELLNIFQAEKIGCHVITVTNAILNKLPLVGKNLEDFSLETVSMFYNDAQAAGFSLPIYRPKVGNE